MRYNFTDRTRRVLAMAREEAIKLQHDYVGTEHILLGLLREEGGTGFAALEAMGLATGDVKKAVEQAVRKGKRSIPRGELPYTSRAKKVLEFAMGEARLLSHPYVGTEHLLLGLVAEEKGIGATVLREADVTLERARATVLQLLEGKEGHVGPGPSEAEPLARGPKPLARGLKPRAGEPKPGRARGRDSAWYLLIDEESGTPIYEQIIGRIEEAVATGSLEAGERLPSVRDLAAELEIAPGTVARAYSELEKQGVVETEGSKGTRVAEPQPSGEAGAGAPGWVESLLRKVVVAAFHRGATAQEVRDALERAMKGILKVL